MRLDPDPRAPSRARELVAAALDGPAREELRDTATLLVSELVTNAVVHAASAVDLEVEVAAGVVMVRVRDADTGPLVMNVRGGSELDEGGRGFVLVDQLADAWGTEHHAGRKTVWFRIADPATNDGTGTDAQTDVAATAPPATAAPLRQVPRRPMQLRTLLLPPALADVVAFDEHVAELLMRVVEATGAAGARLRFDVEDMPVVVRGDLGAPTAATHELVIDDRVLGRLEVHATELTDDARAFLALAADRLALLAASHGLLQADRARIADLDFLAEATELLTRSLSVSLSLALVTQIVVPRLSDWCAAYVVDDRGRPHRLTAHHRLEDRNDLVAALLDDDRELAESIADVAAGAGAQRLPLTASVSGQRNHVVVLPLSSRSRVLGVLVLGRAQPLDPVAFMAATELARRAALAVDNARLHEEQVATVTALQSSLLPSALPRVDDVQLAARYHSASAGISVGGDFYDAFPIADGEIALAIGDVCGKGAEAAAVTGMARDLLRMLLQDGVGLGASLRRLNRALAEHPNRGRFCTVALARLRHAEETMVVQLCLAGHPEPVLLHADGTTELVGTPGDLLGVLDDDELSLVEVDVKMAPGDSLVLYTDGVTERREGGAMFGQFGVRRTLEQAVGAGADGLAEKLENAARSFVATDLRDDVAILVLQRNPR